MGISRISRKPWLGVLTPRGVVLPLNILGAMCEGDRTRGLAAPPCVLLNLLDTRGGERGVEEGVELGLLPCCLCFCGVEGGCAGAGVCERLCPGAGVCESIGTRTGVYESAGSSAGVYESDGPQVGCGPELSSAGVYESDGTGPADPAEKTVNELPPVSSVICNEPPPGAICNEPPGVIFDGAREATATLPAALDRDTKTEPAY